MKKYILLIALAVSVLTAKAQFNVDRLITSGKVALHYEDYVLSIQYFNQVIALKPFLYEPWQYRAVAKFYLDDFVGAETDASEAIALNPYIDILYDLRAKTTMMRWRRQILSFANGSVLQMLISLRLRCG